MEVKCVIQSGFRAADQPISVQFWQPNAEDFDSRVHRLSEEQNLKMGITFLFHKLVLV